MLFSVLMSVYKNEKPIYFDKYLSSLSTQEISPKEIIIVIDGIIPVEITKIILKWKKILPIIEIPLENNVGLGNALNEGLKYCSNNWVFRMDTDDVCTPNRFMKQIEYIQKKPNV